LLNTIAIRPKSEDKYVVKVFNWSEFHLSEMTLSQNPYFKKAAKIDKIFTINLTSGSKCQIDSEDFMNFCGFLKKHEL